MAQLQRFAGQRKFRLFGVAAECIQPPEILRLVRALRNAPSRSLEVGMVNPLRAAQVIAEMAGECLVAAMLERKLDIGPDGEAMLARLHA